MFSVCNLRAVRVAGMLLFVALGAYAGDVDRISYTNGTKQDGWVVSEGVETVVVQQAKTSSGSRKVPAREVAGIVYAGMLGDGYWSQGQAARSGGNYAEAAAMFNALSGAAEGREWEAVYGSFAEGEAQELAQNYTAAATAFGRIVSKYPTHRLALDARYRQGMAQALGKSPEAAATADALSKDAQTNKSLNSSLLETRANAIRAGIAGAAGDLGKVREYATKALSMRPADGRETFYHFSFWLANTYRLNGKGRDAVGIIDRILPELDQEPARQAEGRFIRGMALLESDPSAALIELLALDVLPYGAEDQKCEARYAAGKLLAAEAELASKDADEKKQAIGKELLRSARLVLGAASAALVANPAKDQAKAFLDTLPDPDPAPVVAPGTEAKPVADAAAPPAAN